MGDSGSLDRRRFELLEQLIGLNDAAREALLADAEPALADDLRARFAAAAARDPDFLSPFDGDDDASAWPESVGPYRLIEVLGEGGMGIVFLAEQQEPVRRRVAIKLLRRLVFGREARARFNAERHAMGRLNHPNVGKLLDAGTTEEGLPFFAMELIDGVPITEHCDRERLGLDDRLRLFVAVCRGVEHAHAKLLLHRDIKPSNILVTEVDGNAVPKLIDFGIAKGLDIDWGDLTVATGESRLGTPSYMSPEALELGRDMEDVRSDQFSLGVVLYELLTGRRPWPDSQSSLSSAIQSRSGAAASPSRRVHGLDDAALQDVAQSRSEHPDALPKRLRGDLDRIALQAIAERPTDRYPSVADLAGDIERFLANEPISARAPTTTYLLGKLIQRHRGRFVAAALLVLSSMLGTIGTGIGFVRARAEAERAAHEADAARAARDAALSARQSSDLLADFFVDLFSSDSSSATAAEVLDRDIEALGSRLAEQPRAKGMLLHRIAGIYAEWGDLDKADRLLEDSVALLAPPNATPLPESIDAYETWISVRWKQARFREAGAMTERALVVAERLEQPVAPTRLAKVLGQGGIAMLYIARWRQAEAWLQQSLALLDEVPESVPERGPAMALAQVGLAGLAYDRGRWQEGVERYRRTADALERTFGSNHRRLVILWTFIAYGEMHLGRFDHAEALLERSIELGEHYWFDDGHKLATPLGRLALFYRQRGRSADAESLYRRSLAARREKLPAAHPGIASDLNELAWTIWMADRGRAPEAIEHLEEARALLVEIDEPVYPHHRDIPTRLGTIALAQGRLEEAENRFREACAYVESLDPPLPSDLGICRLHLGRAFWASDRRSEARAAWSEAEAHLDEAGDARRLAEVRALLDDG